MRYHNPIIPGFYPDPSICRVDDHYYMVCSSFHYFPGVPLFESTDLVNWTQIGHVLTRNSQLPLDGCNSVGGIYAPTIRYHEGRFYMVTTNVTAGGNFYVYTDDIHGEWSEPIFVQQGGIDPSLYFENGKAYFMSNGTDDEGRPGIIQCEINIETGEKLTPSRSIWNGAGGRFLESPHLYKIGNYYYLMASEGGTEYGHMVVYARGNDINGPFENYAQNPVLTNRNKGGYRIQGCGHADLVDDPAGNWWMVHLGFRQLSDWVMHHVTGREVYLMPVTFDDDGWFTVGEDGTTTKYVETDRIPDTVVQQSTPDKTFSNTTVGIDWCYMQNPKPENYVLTSDAFRLKSCGVSLNDPVKAPTFLGIRQQEMRMHVETDVRVADGEAGITMYMVPDQHYDLALRRTADGTLEILRRLCIGDIQHEDGNIRLPETASGTVKLLVDGGDHHYHFFAEIDGVHYDLGAAQSKYLSTEVAGNFTGVMIGLYAQGEQMNEFAEFTNFLCRCLEEYE